MSVFFAISRVDQTFAGIVVDRHGARRVLMAGVKLLALSGVALSMADGERCSLHAESAVVSAAVFPSPAKCCSRALDSQFLVQQANSLGEYEGDTGKDLCRGLTVFGRQRVETLAREDKTVHLGHRKHVCRASATIQEAHLADKGTAAEGADMPLVLFLQGQGNAHGAGTDEEQLVLA